MSGQIEDYSSAEAARKERLKEEKHVTFTRIWIVTVFTPVIRVLKYVLPWEMLLPSLTAA